MRKEKYIGIGIAAFVVIWSILLYFIKPEEIVEMLGAQNGYIVMFLVSLFGGVSSFGAVSYLTTLVTLSSGGLEPLYLALASGIGVSVGDSVYFYFGKKGLRSFVMQEEGKYQKICTWIRKVTVWLDARHSTWTFFGIYALTAFTPVPNDIIAISFGLSDRSYLVTVSALVLGNMTHTFLIASFGRILFFM